MSQIEVGAFRSVRFKKQTAQGTPATGGSATGEYIRRTTSTMNIQRSQTKSAEQRTSQQRAQSALGVKAGTGVSSGELAPGAYQDFFESLLRQAVQTPPTTGAIITVAAASTGTGTGTFTRSGGSFITDGFKLGMVMRWSGWAAPATANNAHNFIITALTATVMTVRSLDGGAIVAKTAGDSVTGVMAGKATWVPLTGHTRDYYTLEHWFGTVSQSELFTDVVVTACTIRIPGSGWVTVEFQLMGLDMTTGTTEYFTSPAQAVNSKAFEASGGALLINGARVATLSSLEITITGNYSAPGGVVGSETDPDIFPGSVEVSGTLTALFDNVTVRDAFLNKTPTAVYMAMANSKLPAADFCVVGMGAIEFGGADLDDAEKGLSRTCPFIGLEDITGATNTFATTVFIQDSLFS